MIHEAGGVGLLAGWQSFSSIWWEAMGRVCLGGTVVLIAAFLLTRLFGRMQAGVRCWMWRLVFLKLLVAFFCLTSISLPVLPGTAANLDGNRGVRTEVGAPAGRSSNPIVSAPGSGSGYNVGSVRRSAASGAGASGLDLLMGILAGSWSIGVAAGLVRIARQYREALSFVRSACPITDPSLLRDFVLTSRATGLHGCPAIHISDLTDVPMLFGVFRPVVILPAAVVTDFSPDECRMMLAHELTHVKRQDLVWSFLSGLAEALFFFHPLVWWAHRELRMSQEICCDEQAIGSIDVPMHAYGSVLVRVASQSTTSKHDGLIAVAMAESSTTIQRRLEAMQTFRLNTGWKRWAPLMVTAVGVVVLLPWRLEAQNGLARQKPVDSKSIQAGGYSLKIVPVANIGGGGGSFSTSSGGNGTSFSFGSGGAVSGSFSGGTGGSFSGTPGSGTVTNSNSFRSNQTLGLDITGRNKEDLLLINGVENLRGVDDQGRAVKGPEMPSMSMFAPMLRPADGKREILFLQTEEGAKSLKTLEGDLIVANGAVRTVTFAASEVRPGASKQVGQVTVTIDSVRETENGYELGISCNTPRTEQTRDIREQMKTMTLGMRSAEVELVGSNGVAYPPNTMGGGASGGGGFASGFSTSGGGNFSTSRTFGDDASGSSASTARLNMSFQPLPNGVRPRSLVVRVVERQGATKRVPFKFSDVTLGEKDKG